MMQKFKCVYKKGVLLVKFIVLCAAAMAQTPDTTVLITSTDQQATIPVIRSGKPFYDIILPGKEGLRPTALYSSDDRVYVGLNYNHSSHTWIPDSTGTKQRVFTHYSINQKAFSIGYQGIFNRLAGHWNLFVEASYDWEKWMNFSGLGNESIPQDGNRNFFRIRSREAIVSTAFQHKIGKQSSVIFTPFYQRIQLRRDDDRFLDKASYNGEELANYASNHFGGMRADLQLQKLDNLLLPTKGVFFSTGVAHVRNITKPRAFTNYNAYTRFYIPFIKHFVLSIENGAATVIGEPEFYQLNAIGGNNLRGFRRDRFWGETIFHNNNELQYLFNAPEKLFKGKIGLLAFADQGRVWKKGEQSDKWHYGYGGGIIVVPYHKIYLSLQYGISEERKGIHLEFRRSL
jgi:outer membrane protein assembly factor BamA